MSRCYSRAGQHTWCSKTLYTLTERCFCRLFKMSLLQKGNHHPALKESQTHPPCVTFLPWPSHQQFWENTLGPDFQHTEITSSLHTGQIMEQKTFIMIIIFSGSRSIFITITIIKQQLVEKHLTALQLASTSPSLYCLLCVAVWAVPPRCCFTQQVQPVNLFN